MRMLAGQMRCGPSARMRRCVAEDPQRLRVQDSFPVETLVREHERIGYPMAWTVDRRNGCVRVRHGDDLDKRGNDGADMPVGWRPDEVQVSVGWCIEQEVAYGKEYRSLDEKHDNQRMKKNPCCSCFGLNEGIRRGSSYRRRKGIAAATYGAHPVSAVSW